MNNISNCDMCVVCDRETPYKKETPIDWRIGYIEGAGQGCFQPSRCEQEKNQTHVIVTEEMIREIPNDSELGKNIRERYYLNRDKI